MNVSSPIPTMTTGSELGKFFEASMKEGGVRTPEELEVVVFDSAILVKFYNALRDDVEKSQGRSNVEI